MTSEDIEIAAQWTGEPGVLVPVLAEIGFLDQTAAGSYAIHDWAQHQPYVCSRPQREEAARAAAKAKWSRTTPEQRTQAAQHAATARWEAKRKHTDACEADASCMQDACSMRAPYPTPTPTPTKSKPSAARSRNGAPDPRHKPIEQLIKQLHEQTFGFKCPWDGSEGTALKQLLAANQAWTAELLDFMVRNRFASEGVNSDRPRLWLKNLSAYGNGPLNKYRQLGAPPDPRAAVGAHRENARSNDRQPPDPNCPRCKGTGWRPTPAHPGREVGCECTYPERGALVAGEGVATL